MVEAARKAGRTVSRDYGEIESLQVSKKGPKDFVTASDLRVEKILIEELQKARPKFSFLTEESGEIKGTDGEFRWIIDPIDGTTNFMHGIPYFAISIGLARKTADGEEMIAGVIYSPIINEMYVAEKGFGSYLNDKRIYTSVRSNLVDCLIGGYFWEHERKPESAGKDRYETILNLVKTFKDVRASGAASMDLAYVAAGRLDGFWHYDLKPWDLSAGMLLVQEAKGIVTELHDAGNPLHTGNIIATNANIHEQLKRIVADKNRK